MASHYNNIELLNNTIPKNTNYLEFGYSFNQSVNMLPQSIKILEFGYSFN